MSRPAAVLDPGERAKQERRRQIMDAAKSVFAEAGYHGASIHAIIERAQIARGTFYLYFESKAAVFDAILDEAMRDLRQRIRRIDVDDPTAAPPQVQLRAQVVATLAYIVQDRPLAMLLLSAGHTPDAEAAERLGQFFDEVRDLLRRAFESGMELGLVRKVEPQLAAAAMLGMIRGVVEQLITQPRAPAAPEMPRSARHPGPEPRSSSPPPSPQAEVDAVVDEVLLVALRGVLA